jgi:hypothetical protein
MQYRFIVTVMSVNNYQSTERNNPEERRPHSPVGNRTSDRPARGRSYYIDWAIPDPDCTAVHICRDPYGTMCYTMLEHKSPILSKNSNGVRSKYYGTGVCGKLAYSLAYERNVNFHLRPVPMNPSLMVLVSLLLLWSNPPPPPVGNRILNMGGGQSFIILSKWLLQFCC